ncbi:MAG: hypothetical protein HZC47_04075 [Methanobacterium sp.]|uniref:hypothetical protein n=1 Tax=Methanobacterium sp. TaxID=2164 RepID=UPI003D65C047|nr:hypothetical protein [Methanobacterium sp.]
MKRSRLNIFKATSMTISILGVLLIIVVIGLFAYLGISALSGMLSGNVDNGEAYDKLSSLKAEYSNLNSQFEQLKNKANASGNKKIKKDSVNTQLELVKANSAITDVESALATNLPIDEVNKRISIATNQLQTAKSSLTTLDAEV